MAWWAVYQVDDAYIVYRYARNLAHGNGFVFNLGERVEGVTCFLWTLVLAPFSAAGLSLPRVAPVLTAIAGLGCLVLVARRHADCEGRDRLAPRDVVAPALLAATPAFAYWSVGALEAVPFALLLSLAARGYAREHRDAKGFSSAIWLGLAGLVRPETPLIVAALAVYRVRRHGLGATLRWIGIVAAFFAPFLAFRRLYFDSWLPNTFYAKTGDPLPVLAGHGWRYFQSCLAPLVPTFGLEGTAVDLAGLLALAGLIVFAWRRHALRTEAIVVLAVSVSMILEGGDWMKLSRFLVPALPCLAVIAGAALLRLSETHRVGTAAAVLLASAFVGNDLDQSVRERNGGQGLVVNAQGYRHAHREIGRYLDEHGAPGDAVALMDIGMIGWDAQRLDVIDITGLTDRQIAHAPGGFLDKQFPVGELLARRPRYIVLVAGFPADVRIYRDPAFQSGYNKLFTVDHRYNWTPPSSYKLWVFERKAP
jgi:arabinofuranosyltransferase